VTGLDNQAQIGGEGTVVGKTSSLLVLVRCRNVVGELTGAHLDLALLIGFAGVLVLFGESLGLVDGEDRSDKSTEGNTVQRVTAGANLTVNLETAAKTITTLVSHCWRSKSGEVCLLRLVVKGLKPLLMDPGILGRVKTVAIG
jgi:hypothetical protein